MNKWICPICGYVIEDEKPRVCPICDAPCEEFEEVDIKEEQKIFDFGENIGIAKEADDNMICDLRTIFSRECLEVGMYLAMSKIATKEGYIKVGEIYKKIAYEEAEHASILAELLGEVVKPWTEENLKLIIEDEYEAIQSKLKLAKKAKELGLDTIYNALNEMCKDEAKHGKEFFSLLNEYFVEL
ncbi:ferritin family protein [Terrisporobacter mayombei]|uniref:Reverse rubrerythrin-2 n=1 Tax=Terrisporobacter mayombei TaxID=1541 RepID=A0ABY9Q035_9FIRM|nr:ferritin family protein [Terrisporobacter mayombei]MCC3867013.1 NADH peroxidase [Terrisporobacter mayombei]WMT81272.1 Reverse rubrerythrin-2 [Terrisporobacter mayombei]